MSALFLALVLSSTNASGRTPEFLDGASREVILEVGQPARVELVALDPLGRPVAYEANGLPERARLVRETGLRSRAEITWEPTEADVGTHEVTVIAANESGGSKQSLRLVVESFEQRWLVPGGGATVFIPNDDKRWGKMRGVSIAFLLYTWAHRNDDPGPGLGSVYVHFDILASDKTAVFTQLDLAAGIFVSVERNPARTWLLPFYGLELGALYSRQLPSTLLHASPILGVHLWSSRVLTIDAQAGYLLPLRGAEFDELRGLRARIGADVAFW